MLTTNPATVYLSKWRDKKNDTYVTMRGALARLAGVLGGSDPETFAWHELRYEDVRAIPGKLSGAGLKPRSINKILSALRGTLECAWRTGALPDDIYRRIKIENETGRSLPSGRALSSEEMNTIVRALPTTEPRDAAVIAVLAGAGLRRIEVVRLTKESYDRTAGCVIALGKRDKARRVPLAPRWRPAFEAWHVTIARGAPIFQLAQGSDPEFRRARRAVSYVVESFYKRNDLAPFTPHDLRRTFGTSIEKAAGIVTAKKLLGHESIETTALYVRSSEEAEFAAVKDV